jgi:TonB family protein
VRIRSLAVSITLIAISVGSPLRAQRKDCGATRSPKHLPAAGALLDSAKTIGEFAVLAGPQGDMLFSLRFDDSDSLPKVRPLEGADARGTLILAHSVRPQKRSGVWAVRVRVTGGAAAAVSIERSMYCPPAPEPGPNANVSVTMMVQVQPGDRLPASGRARVTFEVRVDETGTVSTIRLIESSGTREIDERLTQDMQMRRFQPALLDGAPIPGVYRSDGQSPRL